MATDQADKYLLDQLLNRRTRPVIAALYSQLHTPRPRHIHLVVDCGYVGSALSYADDYIHFTLNIAPNLSDTPQKQKPVWRRHIRCHIDLMAQCCPDLAAGDFIEIVGIAYRRQNATRAVYLQRMEADKPTSLELFTEVLGILLAVQPGQDSTNEGPD